MKVTRGKWSHALAALVMLGAGDVFAQAEAASAAIDIELFKPGPGSSDLLNVQGSAVARQFDWRAGLYVHYSSNPLVVRSIETRDRVARLVASHTTFDLIGAVGLYENLELGVHLPLVLTGSEPAPFVGSNFSNGVGGFGVGDARLVPKYFILRRDELGVAVSLPLILPTGNSSAFLSGGTFGAQPRVIADYSLPNDFRFVGNLGLNLRPASQLLNLRVGNQISYGVGAEFPLKIEGRYLALMSTFSGAVGLPNTGWEEAPMELLLAARYRMMPNLALTVGAGRGLSAGYGTPDFRILGGIAWTETTPDTVKQIVPPEPVKPICRFGAEDLDGFKDDDACGDPDNDADGIEDAPDVCPDDAETRNNYRDTDGCPDEPPVEIAPLPRVPPATDTDGDGILDIEDRCATAAEDKDAFEDTDGCPEPDNDRDGFADGADKCVLEAETINGVTDDDGCPDKGKSKVIVKGEKIVILEKVYFATNKDTILPKSFNVLKQVGSVLKANPHILHVRVEGHTDSQGDDNFNMDLSQRRANSVVAFLVKEGIDPARLKGVGYGETRPVDDNKKAKGRENNRRVEFTIVNDEPAATEEPAPDSTPPIAPLQTPAGAPDAGTKDIGTMGPDGGTP